MLIIVDHRIPEEARKHLGEVAQKMNATVAGLVTEGLVYPEISGHPDIFFCQTPQSLVVSPNVPPAFFRLLDEHKVHYVKGQGAAGDHSGVHVLQSLKQKKLLENRSDTCFNAAINEHYLVHRLEFTDPVILENCHYLKKIVVKQGYTRCNLMLLRDRYYITSDRRIDRSLKDAGLEGIYTDPEQIILPGFPNGFIGGTMGICGDDLYITGNLDFLKSGTEIRNLSARLGYRVTELYGGPLFDGGGILFV
jgi:hypothetical protein